MFVLLGCVQLVNAQADERMAANMQIRQGDMFLHLGRWEEALSAYTMAVQAAPNYADAYLRRANLYKHQQNFDLAMQDYSTALMLNPYAEALYDARARARILALDFKGAESDLEDYRRLAPDNQNSREQLADAYLMLGNYKAARRELEPLLEADQTDTVLLLKQSLVLFQAGELDLAEHAIRQDPSDPEAWNLRGNVELMFGRYNEAIADYTRALNMKPDYAEAMHNRGVAYLIRLEPLSGCPDLTRSAELGYERSVEIMPYFCLP